MKPRNYPWIFWWLLSREPPWFHHPKLTHPRFGLQQQGSGAGLGSHGEIGWRVTYRNILDIPYEAWACSRGRCCMMLLVVFVDTWCWRVRWGTAMISSIHPTRLFGGSSFGATRHTGYHPGLPLKSRANGKLSCSKASVICNDVNLNNFCNMYMYTSLCTGVCIAWTFTQQLTCWHL